MTGLGGFESPVLFRGERMTWVWVKDFNKPPLNRMFQGKSPLSRKYPHTDKESVRIVHVLFKERIKPMLDIQTVAHEFFSHDYVNVSLSINHCLFEVFEIS